MKNTILSGSRAAFADLMNVGGEHRLYPHVFAKALSKSHVKIGHGYTGFEDVQCMLFSLALDDGSVAVHGFEPTTTEAFMTSPSEFVFVDYEEFAYSHWFCFQGGWEDTGCRVRPSDPLHPVLDQARRKCGIVVGERVGFVSASSPRLKCPAMNTRSRVRYSGRYIGECEMGGFAKREDFVRVGW